MKSSMNILSSSEIEDLRIEDFSEQNPVRQVSPQKISSRQISPRQVSSDQISSAGRNDREVQAAIRRRLLLAFAEGAAVGLLVGQFLLLFQYYAQDTMSVTRTHLICILTGGICGYLLRLLRMLLLR